MNQQQKAHVIGFENISQVNLGAFQTKATPQMVDIVLNTSFQVHIKFGLTFVLGKQLRKKHFQLNRKHFHTISQKFPSQRTPEKSETLFLLIEHNLKTINLMKPKSDLINLMKPKSDLIRPCSLLLKLKKVEKQNLHYVHGNRTVPSCFAVSHFPL